MQEILDFIITLLKILPVAVLIYLIRYIRYELRAKKLYKARFTRFVDDYRASRNRNRKKEDEVAGNEES